MDFIRDHFGNTKFLLQFLLSIGEILYLTILDLFYNCFGFYARPFWNSYLIIFNVMLNGTVRWYCRIKSGNSDLIEKAFSGDFKIPLELHCSDRLSRGVERVLIS